MDILFYINVSLIIIIFLNVIIISYITTEYFAIPQSLNAPLKSCTIYLTEEQDLCDKLEKLYRMSNTQLEIAFNKMNNTMGKAKSALVLKYIIEQKKNIKNFSCKLQYSNLKEVLSDNYLNIRNSIEYNEANLSGYCLAKISANDPSTTKINITDTITNTTDLYKPIRINSYKYDSEKSIDENNIKINETIDNVVTSLVNSTPSLCSYTKHKLDNGLKFLKLYCRLDRNRLICNKIDILIYQNGNFIKQNNDYNMRDFFNFNYNTKQILYTSKNIRASSYSFIFDLCNKIDEFLINNSINFSFADFYIEPKIIIYDIKLSSSTIINENTNIYSIINARITEIFSEIDSYNNLIKIYNKNIEDSKNTYNLSKNTCEKIIDEQERIICDENLDSEKIKEISLIGEKEYLTNKIQKLREEYRLLVQSQEKLRNIGTTIGEINDFIKSGIILNYNKYSDLLSNDDCIYIQFT